MKIVIGVLFSMLFPAVLPAQVRPTDRMVVVISLDGFPAYELDDPALPVPTLRALIAKGVTARMSTVNPTVTWPNHTSMVTGVRPEDHGLLVNGTLVQTNSWPPVKIDPMVEKTRMVHVPTIYDAAHAAGLTTAQVDWVAINRAPTINWAFTEWADPAGTVEQEMIRGGLVTAGDVQNFTKLNILYRDQVWARAAAYLIRTHKPNLLLVHFLSLDSMHHRYGPKVLAATGAIAFLDGCVGQVLNAVREAGMQDRASIFVVADHGFKAYTKEIRVALALKAAGLDDKAYVINEGGSAIIYVAKANHDELVDRVAMVAEGVEGIDRVVRSSGFSALGLPTPAHDSQMGDLFLTARAGYSFAGGTGGPVTPEAPQVGGSHGYISTDPDMDALFIASGAGIRSGAKIDRIANIDLAPTIAQLLGLNFPSAKGKAIPIVQR